LVKLIAFITCAGKPAFCEALERAHSINLCCLLDDLLNDRMQQRIKRLNATNVTKRQLPTHQLPGSHEPPEAEGCGFNEIETA